MGSVADVIPLEASPNAAPLARLREVTLQFLGHQWDDMLSKEQADEAWGWVSLGEDSLLTIGDSDADENAPAGELAFWFYLSVDWPSERARHWLYGALVAGRKELEDRLGEIGYKIAGDFPTLAQVLDEHGCPVCNHLNRATKRS